MLLSETTCPLSLEAWHRAAEINSVKLKRKILELFPTLLVLHFFTSPSYILCKTCPIQCKLFNLSMLAHVDLISLFNIKTQSNQAHLLKKDNFNFTLLL